nr:hypothetical protein [uncultured Cohaesibacter sp.]
MSEQHAPASTNAIPFTTLQSTVWKPYPTAPKSVSLAAFASSITRPRPALTMVLAVPFLGDAIALYKVAALAVVIASIYGLTLARLRTSVGWELDH